MPMGRPAGARSVLGCSGKTPGGSVSQCPLPHRQRQPDGTAAWFCPGLSLQVTALLPIKISDPIPDARPTPALDLRPPNPQ